MNLHISSEICHLQYLTFIYIHDVLRIFYENSCTIPTIKFFFLPCKAMSYGMKYEKLLIQWTMHPHVTSEIRRLECLTFIYIHDLLRFFYENSFTFPTIKVFLLPCKAMSYWMKYEELLLTFCNPIICYWISVILQKKKWQIALYD